MVSPGDGLRELTIEQSFELLQRHGIGVPWEVVAADARGVEAAVGEAGQTVVLKAVVPNIAHKSDIGGVAVGLTTPAEAGRAAEEMGAKIPGLEGFVVQEFVAAPPELFVGMRRDPVLGPFVLLGIGGLWVEVLDDVSIRPAPLDEQTCEQMVDQLRASAILDGYRGQPVVDRAALYQLLMAVGNLAVNETDIYQIDLNPTVVTPGGAVALDRHILRGTSRSARSDRPDSSEGLRALMEPSSIAVIGASNTPGKPGRRVLEYLLKHGYAGNLYAVNPRGEDVLGVPCFRTFAELPEPVDLACIAVPAPHVLDVVETCAAGGCGSAVIYTSGFAEAGVEGEELQSRLGDLATKSGMRICGPNTSGIVNAYHDMCAAFGMAFEIEEFPRGDVAFITQSGALGSSLLSRLWGEGVGVSSWTCCGNEADLSLGDYLGFAAADDNTQVISMFVEGVKHPDAFAKGCAKARANGKPVLAYKTGASELGSRAVESHTAGLAGDDRLYDAMLHANGVVRLDSLQALVDASIALSWQPLPRGRRVAVISASGGACSVVADECSRRGLELPALSAETAARVAELIPSFGRSENPIDVTVAVTSSPDMISDVAAVLIDEPYFDALLVMLTTNAGPTALEVARGVAEIAERTDKPVIVARVGADYLAPESVDHYRKMRIPTFPMPERAVEVLSVMARAAEAIGVTEGYAGAVQSHT